MMARGLLNSTPAMAALAFAALLAAWMTRDWSARESERAATAHRLAIECDSLAGDITARRQDPQTELSELDRDGLIRVIRSVPRAPRLDRITGRQATRGGVQVRQIETSLASATIPSVHEILTRVVKEYPSARIDSVACAHSSDADGWDVTLVVTVGVVPKEAG